jgi:hypothetical protein
MDVEGESKRMTSGESLDSPNHSLLMIVVNSFTVILRNFSSAGLGRCWLGADGACQVPKTRGTHNQRSRKNKTTPKALPTKTGRAKTANETP